MQPLMEMWLDIGVEKLDSHEVVSVKVLLNSRATEMFVDKKFIEKHGFKKEKLDRPVRIRNVNGMANSRRLVIDEIECNIYYKRHVEQMRIDVYELEKTEVILDMLWLAAHNLEINWETREVKITRCLPMCEKKVKIKKTPKRRKVRVEDEKDLR